MGTGRPALCQCSKRCETPCRAPWLNQQSAEQLLRVKLSTIGCQINPNGPHHYTFGKDKHNKCFPPVDMFWRPFPESCSSCRLASWVGANCSRVCIMLSSKMRYCKASSPSHIPPCTSLRAFCCRCRENNLPSPAMKREYNLTSSTMANHSKRRSYFFEALKGFITFPSREINGEGIELS